MKLIWFTAYIFILGAIGGAWAAFLTQHPKELTYGQKRAIAIDWLAHTSIHA
jgi:hypothetical protein